MDSEMAELHDEMFSVDEFDIEYEFDAPRFYDFSRPESDFEEKEAELWFESAGDYPPSPFMLKFNLCDILEESANACSVYKTIGKMNPADADTMKPETAAPEDKFNGFIHNDQHFQDTPKKKAASKSQNKPSLSRSSTLTKPTACLLARLNKPLDAYSVQLLRRCQRSIGKSDEKISTLLSSVIQSQDTKRQKLEAGYLRKIGRMNSINGRSKVTIPKEPELRTAQRAERLRSSVNPDRTEPATSNANTSVHRKKTRAFHLRTSERATQRALQMKNAVSDASMPESNTKKSKTPKLRKSHNRESKVCPLDQKITAKESLHNIENVKEETSSKTKLKVPEVSGFQDEPLIDSFNRLSLGPDAHSSVKCQSPTHNSAEIVNKDVKSSESFSSDQIGHQYFSALTDEY